MKSAIALFLSLLSQSFAHRTTFKVKPATPSLQRRAPQSDSQTNVGSTSSSENKFSLSSAHDLVYIADITLGGVDYAVQLDTGSSDLFIKGESYPVPNSTETNLLHNLTYAIGWASGHIAYAPVEFVGISVPSQAFVDANEASNPALSYGAQGIAGLGFNRLSSIDHELNTTGSTTGKSLLYNLFHANPSEPNFIAFALHRSTQEGGDVEGSFAIGEFEPEYMSISGNERIPTWPPRDPYRWNVLLDALIVNDTIVPGTTQIPNAPSNKAVVLLDSGSSYTYAPPSVCEAIYGKVPGARFDSKSGYWRVPCAEEVYIALQIGGQVFPVHSLDVTPSTITNKSICIGSFVPETFDPSWGFDWLIGDNFLRSVYSVYDFGDFDEQGQMGDPYVKLLSVVDPDEASVEFHKERGGTPRTNITYIGLDGVSVAPSFFISNDISNTLETISKFMPAVLGIVALNALVVVVGSITWLVLFIRKRRRRAMARQPRAREGRTATPLSPVNSYIAGVGSPEAAHQYQPIASMALSEDMANRVAPFGRVPSTPERYDPVSMALTEDSFVPPSPAFHQDRTPGDRPKSVA